VHQRFVIAGFEVHIRFIEQRIVDDGRDAVGRADGGNRTGIAVGKKFDDFALDRQTHTAAESVMQLAEINVLCGRG